MRFQAMDTGDDDITDLVGVSGPPGVLFSRGLFPTDMFPSIPREGCGGSCEEEEGTDPSVVAAGGDVSS